MAKPLKVLQAGLTKECMERIMKGEIERIEVDADTILEIRYAEKIVKPAAGVRGPGMYLFTCDLPPTACGHDA